MQGVNLKRVGGAGHTIKIYDKLLDKSRSVCYNKDIKGVLYSLTAQRFSLKCLLYCNNRPIG